MEETVNSLRIGTQMLAKNLGGFVEGYKGEEVDLDEFLEFIKFAEERVDSEYSKDALQEIRLFLEGNDIETHEENPEDWLQIAEDFYEDREQ